jgi:hypothetical protein
MVETQRRAMEMEKCEVEAVAKKRHAILDKATLLEKHIKIPEPKHFMWTPTKHNYDKHVKQVKKWKDIIAK